MSALAPRLDRRSEPWVGRFPGLGEVRVFADGRYDVSVLPGTPPTAAESLEHGWAVPLSCVRQGLWMATAWAVCDPASGTGLLFTGDHRNCASLMGGLLSQGWRPLSTWMSALSRPGAVVAHPLPGPLLSSSRAPGGGRAVPWAPSLAYLSVATWPEPVEVRALAVLRERTATPPDVETLPARRRLGLRLVQRWQAGEPASTADAMSLDLELSRIPTVAVSGPSDRVVEQVLPWWESLS